MCKLYNTFQINNILSFCLVSLCLQALCSVLPAQVCTEFMIAYCGYSFCSNSEIETSWNRFENWLYVCLRMRPSPSSSKKMVGDMTLLIVLSFIEHTIAGHIKWK